MARRRAREARAEADALRERAARLRAEARSGRDGGTASPSRARVHAAEVQVVNLRRAQLSDRRVGMAMGILMARHRLTEDQAFGLLRTASSHRNVRLRTIAEEVIYTGDLQVPSDRRPRHGQKR